MWWGWPDEVEDEAYQETDDGWVKPIGGEAQ